MVDNSTLTVKIDGEDRDLFMSYGLLTALSKKLPTADAVGAIPHDPELRDVTLLVALAERSKTGKITKALDSIEDIDISMEDVERVLDWVMEHLTGFFVRGLEKSKKVLDAQAKLETLFSENGSQA